MSQPLPPFSCTFSPTAPEILEGLNTTIAIYIVYCTKNSVKIYTRWGDKVFEVKDYDNLNSIFEGKSDSGKDLPSGVYFYKVSFDNGKEGLSGYLTLKR